MGEYRGNSAESKNISGYDVVRIGIVKSNVAGRGVAERNVSVVRCVVVVIIKCGLLDIIARAITGRGRVRRYFVREAQAGHGRKWE